MSTTTLKRLPSADWLAFGVALAAVFLKYLEPALMSIVALVVFLPSILRETGLLKDADEWTLGLMRRAGFHATLAVVGLMTLNYVAVQVGGFEATEAKRWPIEVQTFRLVVMWVFLVSYVIQYWGAREGVFRILVVAGVMNLAPVMVNLRPDATPRWSDGGWIGLPAAALACGLFVGLAWLVRRRPRAGAGVMLAGFVLWGCGVWVLGRQADIRAWDFASSLLQNGIVFGITAGALIHEHPGREAI